MDPEVISDEQRAKLFQIYDKIHPKKKKRKRSKIADAEVAKKRAKTLSASVSEPRFNASPSASLTVGGRSITGHIEDSDDFVTGTQLADRRHHSEICLQMADELDVPEELGEAMCDEKWPSVPEDPPVSDPTGTMTGDVLRSLVFGGVFILMAYFIVEERDYARPLAV